MQQLSALVENYQIEAAKPLSVLFDDLRNVQSAILPSDVLFGSSHESQYQYWINTQLKPKLRKLGAEGHLWWRAITKVDLASDPELLWRVMALLTMWFFPEYHEYLRYAETLAFLVVIRKLAADDELDK